MERGQSMDVREGSEGKAWIVIELCRLVEHFNKLSLLRLLFTITHTHTHTHTHSLSLSHRKLFLPT